jgi:two-component system chemotaxis response regulator CheB
MADSIRALIVDDSKPVRSILAKMLVDLGYECDQAGDGEEALAILARGSRPDVVTVNLHMPVMDGFAFIERIRGQTAFKSLPVVAMSSDRSPEVVDRAIRAGADVFVAKPFTTAAIGEALTAIGLRAVSRSGTVSAASEPLRVLIVDDSAAIRGIVSTTLSADPDLHVAATAADGVQGLARVAECRPDVVLLDVEMPVMDGLTMLRELRRVQPRLPVVMFSTLTERGAKVALDALVAGANDYVAKPKGATSDEVAARIREDVIPKLKQFRRTVATPGSAPAALVPKAPPRPRTDPVAAVVVGVSTGGPVALAEFLPAFVKLAHVPVLIVQHMPAVFTAHLADQLTKVCGLPIREAPAGHELRPGDVFLAPGGRHLKVARSGTKVITQIDDGPPENACRPAADVLFRSAAAAWGRATLAVVLTGMGKDGLKGSEAIHAAGGTILAQDEMTSVVWGMPGHVARAGLADAVLPLRQLGVEVGMRLRRRG